MSEPVMDARRLWPTVRVSDAKGGKRILDDRGRRTNKSGTILYGANLADAVTHEPKSFVSPQLTFWSEAFPVSRTPSLADDWVPPTSAISGPSSPELFARLGPDGWLPRTSQDFCQPMLDGSLATFSETWPRAGMTRNGIAYQRVPSAPLTDATGSGSWPTPRNCTAMAAAFTENTPRAKFPNLETIVSQRHWPTPKSSPSGPDYARRNRESSGGDDLVTILGGSLNPTWVEWLMGYPLEWTALEASAIASCRKSRNGSHGASSKRKRSG